MSNDKKSLKSVADWSAAWYLVEDEHELRMHRPALTHLRPVGVPRYCHLR